MVNLGYQRLIERGGVIIGNYSGESLMFELSRSINRSKHMSHQPWINNNSLPPFPVPKAVDET